MQFVGNALSENARQYGYDLAGRMVTYADAANRGRTYTYDAAGQNTAIQFPDGKIATYAFDPLGSEASPGNAGTTRKGPRASLAFGGCSMRRDEPTDALIELCQVLLIYRPPGVTACVGTNPPTPSSVSLKSNNQARRRMRRDEPTDALRIEPLRAHPTPQPPPREDDGPSRRGGVSLA